MFANIFRSQAKFALTSLGARASVVRCASNVTRIHAMPTVSTTRLLSTSRPVWNYGEEEVRGEREVRQRTPSPPTNTLYVGNLPYRAQESELRERFENFGPIADVRIAFSPDGMAKGFAHIEFVNDADAMSAVESTRDEPIYMLDRNVRVDFANRQSRTERERLPSHSLYFSGYRGGREDLQAATRGYESSIINVHFLTDRMTGKDTGAGFIHFVSVERATEALNELSGLKLAGDDTLFLRYATPARKRGGDGGGRQRDRGPRERSNDY